MILMLHPATVTLVGRSDDRNLWRIPLKALYDFSGFGSRSSDQNHNTLREIPEDGTRGTLYCYRQSCVITVFVVFHIIAFHQATDRWYKWTKYRSLRNASCRLNDNCWHVVICGDTWWLVVLHVDTWRHVRDTLWQVVARDDTSPSFYSNIISLVNSYSAVVASQTTHRVASHENREVS